MGDERQVEIPEQDQDVILFRIAGPKGTVEVIAQIQVEGETAVLRRAHIQGPGPRSIGLRELRLLAREFGRRMGVKRVIVYGSIRLTGANPGRLPRALRFEVY